MGEGIGGLGRTYIKFELCPFAKYSCVMEKRVFVLYFIFQQFRTNLLDMPHRIWGKISQILEFIALSWNGEGDWWVGEALYIKFEPCPFAIYSCVMEKGVFVLYYIFHQFRTNLLDMPHRIWRKISQIM